MYKTIREREREREIGRMELVKRGGRIPVKCNQNQKKLKVRVQ